MADEMLRIAGRGDDGKAKGIKTNKDGEMITQIKNFTKLDAKDITIAPQDVYSFSKIKADGEILDISLKTDLDITVRVGFYNNETDTMFTYVEKLTPTYGNSKQYRKFSTKVFGAYYTIQLINNYYQQDSVNIQRFFAKETQSNSDQLIQKINNKGSGVKIYADTVLLDNNQTYAIFNYPAGNPIALEIFEVSHNYIGVKSNQGLSIFLNPRDSNGDVSEFIARRHVRRNATKDPNEPNQTTTPSRLTGQTIKDHGSSLFDILHYDENEPAFKFALRREFYMPNGGELKIANNATSVDGLQFSYMAIVREL